MSDITEAPAQVAIADSLLSAPIVGDHSSGEAFAESGAAVEAEQSQQNDALEQQADLSVDRHDWRAENAEVDPFVAQEAVRRNAEGGEQSQPLTPEQIQDGIQSLDTLVRENNLNDPQSAKEFANDFCAAFGTDAYAAGVNVEQFGNVMSRVALSALDIFGSIKGNTAQVPPMPQESARAFTHDFLKAFGLDPRTTRVNEQVLAEVVLRGAVNFIDGYSRLGGKVNDLSQLNHPEAAEQFLAGINWAFGVNVAPNREAALKLADAGGKYLLGFMNRIGQMQQRTQPQQRAGRRGSSGQGRRFRTNSDIFSPDVLERLDLEKTSRGNAQEFAPKGRRGSTRFQSNADIFDDETMAHWQREHGRI